MENLIGKEFKTIAAAKNFIMKTNIYSSKMGSENYVGRNKADGMGGGGFTDEDGIHNMFITLGRTDANWTNLFYDVQNMWLETCTYLEKEKRDEWVNSRFADKKRLRVFLMEVGAKTYKCKGVYKQMDIKLETSTVAWRRC